MPHASELAAELANELQTWPGVRIESRSRTVAVVFYEDLELGVLDGDAGVAELRFPDPERDAIVEHGDAQPAEPIYGAENVSHALEGPSDVSAVLELLDRRYRELRGQDDPRGSQDPS